MKINVNEELGIKKPIEVRATNLNMERSLQMQLDLAKAGDVAEDTDILETLEQSLKMVKKMTDYIKNILKLSDIQSEKVDELEQEETAVFVNRLCLRIMGNTDEEIEALFEAPVSEAEKK